MQNNLKKKSEDPRDHLSPTFTNQWEVKSTCIQDCPVFWH